MPDIAFLVKRAARMDWKRMFETADMLSGKTGLNRAWLLRDMLRCAVRFNAGYMDYKIAEMYRLNDAQKRTVITRGISNAIVRKMNDKAYWHFFDDKTEFNSTFADHIGRKWIRLDENTDPEKFRDFLSGRFHVHEQR